MPPFPPTLSPLEVLWIAAACYGLLFSWNNRREALRSERLVRAHRVNGALLLIATSHVRRETTRMAAIACCLGIGVIAAMTRPNPVAPPTRQVVSILFLLGVEFFLVLNTWWDRRDRRLLLALLRLEANGTRGADDAHG